MTKITYLSGPVDPQFIAAHERFSVQIGFIFPRGSHDRFWLTALFISFGVFAPRNATVVARYLFLRFWLPESRSPGLLVLTVLTASQCGASFPSQARLIGIASKTCNFAADQVNPRKDK